MFLGVSCTLPISSTTILWVVSTLKRKNPHKKLHSVVDLLQEIFRDFSELLLLKTSIFDRQFDYFANISKFHPVNTYVLQ